MTRGISFMAGIQQPVWHNAVWSLNGYRWHQALLRGCLLFWILSCHQFPQEHRSWCRESYKTPCHDLFDLKADCHAAGMMVPQFTSGPARERFTIEIDEMTISDDGVNEDGGRGRGCPGDTNPRRAFCSVPGCVTLDP